MCVLNRLLERPIDSMCRARLLNNLSSIWAGPVCSMNCRVKSEGVYYVGGDLIGVPGPNLHILSSRWAWPIYSIFCRVNGPGSRWNIYICI